MDGAQSRFAPFGREGNMRILTSCVPSRYLWLMR